MPTWGERIAGGLSGVAARVESVARAIRGPNATRVAPMPGAMTTSATAAPSSGGVWDSLREWAAYTGRVAPALGPTHARYTSDPASDLTPEKIINAQKGALAGFPIRWMEMIEQVHGRDGHFASVANQRVADVIKGSWSLRPAKTDPISAAVLNFTDDAYRACSGFRDGLGWLLYSNLYGYTPIEVEWEERRLTFAGPKGEILGPIVAAVPKRLYNVHPKHVRFDLITDDPQLWTGEGAAAIPFGKFVILDGEGLQPVKVRHGYSWQCIWYSMFRSIGWSGWAAFVERFGMPIPLIKYQGDYAQAAEMRTAYTDILNSLGSAKGAIVPADGATFDFVQAPAGGRSSDPHSALASACDSAQSIRVLGATLTNATGNTGSFAQAEVHGRTKEALEEQDAARLWERIDEQLTAAVVAFNAQPICYALNMAGYRCTPDMIVSRRPRGSHIVPADLDTQGRANIWTTAINEWGLQVSKEAAYHRFDIPRPISADDVIKGEPTDIAKGGKVVGAVEAANEGAENEDPAAEAQAQATLTQAGAPGAAAPTPRPAAQRPAEAKPAGNEHEHDAPPKPGADETH